jgi:acetylglutamate kinase
MNQPIDRDVAVVGLQAALPYVRMFRGKEFVVKVGGAICADPVALRNLAAQISVLVELGIRVVLVHGGGPQTTSLSTRLGLETKLVGGRRVTDEATLEAVVMSINGSVRTAILAAFRTAGVPAVGLSGVDAGLVQAVRRPKVETEVDGVRQTVDYGLVGDIVSVRGSVLRSLLDAGMLPVVSPLSADDAGQVLNINADTVASAVAVELSAEKLIFVTETNGLLEDPGSPSSLVSYTDLAGVKEIVARSAAGGGMLPKLEAARSALLGGVRRVHMVGYRSRSSLLVEVFTNEGSGTLIVKSLQDLSRTEQSPLP